MHYVQLNWINYYLPLTPVSSGTLKLTKLLEVMYEILYKVTINGTIFVHISFYLPQVNF